MVPNKLLQVLFVVFRMEAAIYGKWAHLLWAFCQIREIQTLKLILDLKWLAEDFMHNIFLML